MRDGREGEKEVRKEGVERKGEAAREQECDREKFVLW